MSSPSASKYPGPKPFKERWPGEGRLRAEVLEIQTRNQQSRVRLMEYGETLNKVLDKVGLKKASTLPTMQSQFEVVSKQLQNAVKLIEINRQELRVTQRQPNVEKDLETLAESNFLIKERKEQLEDIRRQVFNLEIKNKTAEAKLGKYFQNGQAKSLEYQTHLKRELLHQNGVLRLKLERYFDHQTKQQEWLQNNEKDSHLLKRRLSVLPSISSTRLGSITTRRGSVSSLEKLSSQKNVYSKWLESRRPRKTEKLDKELEDQEQMMSKLVSKIAASREEIALLQSRKKEYRLKVTPKKLQQARQIVTKQQDFVQKLRNAEVNCDIRFRQIRRDWIGRFSGARFSDSRQVREETRMYKIVHNDSGYYQFHYYSIADHKVKYTCPLPFDASSLAPGKESAFTTDYPDYIKSFKLRINPKIFRIVGMEVLSNKGLSCEFNDSKEILKMPLTKKQLFKGDHKEEDPYGAIVDYQVQLKPNEAPTLVFGSYSVKYNEKRVIVGLYLEGLGMDIIEDYVSEVS